MWGTCTGSNPIIKIMSLICSDDYLCAPRLLCLPSNKNAFFSRTKVGRCSSPDYGVADSLPAS